MSILSSRHLLRLQVFLGHNAVAIVVGGARAFPVFCPVIMASTRRVQLSQPTHPPLLWGLLPISPSGRCMLEQPALWHTMSSIKFSRRLVRLPQLGMCAVCFALLGICDLACHTCHHGG